MASFALRQSPGTLLLSLLFAAGCTPEESLFPPPQDADTSTLTQGGTGGGTPDNACECAAEAALGQPDCGDCINALYASGKCVDEIFQCESEPVCVGIVQCPATCYGKTGGALTDCVAACFASPANQDAYQRFQDVMACACSVCAQKCATSWVVACP